MIDKCINHDTIGRHSNSCFKSVIFMLPFPVSWKVERYGIHVYICLANNMPHIYNAAPNNKLDQLPEGK
jgi:hypothetical protein